MGFISLFKQKSLGIINDINNRIGWDHISIFNGQSATRNIKHYVEHGYGKNPYVYMVVKKISDITSRLPYQIVDVNGKEQNDINFSLFLSPNVKQTTQEFIDTIVTELEVTGNAYIHIIKVGGRPVELQVLSAKNTTPHITIRGILDYYEYQEFTTISKIYPEDIWHIKFNNPTGSDIDRLTGLSPLQSAMQIVESSNDIFEAEGHLFKNRGVSTILTNDSDRPMLPKEKKEIQDQFDEQVGGAARYGKIRISTAKLRAIDIGLTPAQLQLSQNSIAKLRVICGVYGISPIIFGDNESSTYNNMQEAEKAMHLNVVLPLAEMITKELNGLFQQYFKTKNKIVINKDSISAIKTINTDLHTMVREDVKAGIISVDDAKLILYPNS